jgi:hypothetical protein
LLVSVVTYDPEKRELVGPGWHLPASTFRDTSDARWGPSFEADIQIRHRVYLCVEWNDEDAVVWIELFDGEIDSGYEPPEKHALAVISNEGREPKGIVAVPLCDCGIRGCGNSGTQFAHSIPPESVPGVIDFVSSLKDLNEDVNGRRTLLNEWDCDSHALIPLPLDWRE